MRKSVYFLVSAAIIAATAYAAASLAQSARLAIGLLVGVPSLVLLVISRVQLGKSFSVMPEARALVTTGIYSRIQHPLFMFLDVFLIAIIVLLGWPILLWAWGVLVVAHVFEARREEKVLAAAFGAEYEAYRSRTWF